MAIFKRISIGREEAKTACTGQVRALPTLSGISAFRRILHFGFCLPSPALAGNASRWAANSPSSVRLRSCEESMSRETSIDIHCGEVDALIAKWRHATVAMASRGVPPHITLLYPWRRAPITAADMSALKSVVKEQRPFSLVFTRVQHFSNRVLYLAVNEDSEVKTLRLKIVAAFPDASPYGGEFSTPITHLTIARAPDDVTFDALMHEVSASVASELPIEIFVREIVVMEEGEDTNWNVHSVIALDEQ